MNVLRMNEMQKLKEENRCLRQKNEALEKEIEYVKKTFVECCEWFYDKIKFGTLHGNQDTKHSWFRCPNCGKALFPIRSDTRIEHMPFRCKACKHDIEVNV